MVKISVFIEDHVVFRLTAFVAKVFHEAQKFLPVQDETLARMITWVMAQQAENGSFIEVGRIIHTYMQVFRSSTVDLYSVQGRFHQFTVLLIVFIDHSMFKLKHFVM